VAAVVIADTPIAWGGLVQVDIDARGSRRGKVMSEQKPVENQAETPAESPATTGELSSEELEGVAGGVSVPRPGAANPAVPGQQKGIIAILIG
jgi:hypothetical protein